MNVTQKPGLSLNNAANPWALDAAPAEGDRVYSSQNIIADKWVTHVFPLNKTMEAFEMAMRPCESIRVVIEP